MTDGLSIPLFSAAHRVCSHTVLSGKTLISGLSRDQGQADWMTLVRRSNPVPPSPLSTVTGRDEETGDLSEVQTRIGDISEVDKCRSRVSKV